MSDRNPAVPAATRILAEFAAGVRYEAIPQPVIEHIKLTTLDGLGCCLYGATLPWTRMVADVVMRDGGRPEATVIGTDRRAPVAGAILVNATAGHAFELDDIHRDSILHPNSIAVPTALAFAERAGGASGRDVLTAIVAGYEISARVGLGSGTDLLLRGFHPQGVLGSICAAVTAAHMLRLDTDRMHHAIGIAASLGAGLMAAQEGAMVKRLHSGRAAEAGVRAAELAADGFTGIEDVVEAGYGGFLSAFAGSDAVAAVLEGLGETWEAGKSGFKPHATVTSIHAALDALAAIMSEHGLTTADIATIRAGISNPTYVHCAWPYRAQSVTAAQMNIFYGLAVMARDGAAFVDQFKPDRIADPATLELIGRIEAAVDPEIEALGRAFRHMARITVITTDGRTFTREERYRRGSPENPVSRDGVLAKFMTQAGAVLPSGQCEALKSDVLALDAASDVAPVIERLVVRN